ncbi:MAG TPA: DUF6515 family protein, partial [Vicinamibacteria bacterium]|nr:DUF6515 family protein [Vicinamibacteria bacterium]
MSRVTTSLALSLVAVLLAPPAWAQRRGGGGGRGSVRSVNRTPSGGSWSGSRGSGSTSQTRSGDSSHRTTTYDSQSGRSATATRDVNRDGDTVTVDRNVQGSQGGSVSKQKEYQLDDGRVESVERDVRATDRSGRTAEWEGKAEREGAGWEFEGEGKNRYGQDVSAEGYAGRGAYGRGVVADVEGGRYGDRTVVAGKPYGGRGYVSTLPAGYRPYNYYGRPYYGYGGAYYRPYYGGYYPVPPPYGYCCYHDDDLVGAIALTMVGTALLVDDGVYYEKTYVEGETQYKVVPAPEGASVPANALPADVATVTVAGTVYYFHANTFYKVAPKDGQLGFVVVQKPTGVVTLKELPADVKPEQAGTLTYFASGGKHYMPYLDAAGAEQYIQVDSPKGQVAGTATATKTVPVTIPAGTTLTVRLASEVSSGSAKAGSRFQANLEQDLLVGGQLVAGRGARVSGRVAEAKAGTGMGGAPVLALELTDIEIGSRVTPIVTEKVQAKGEGKKPTK